MFYIRGENDRRSLYFALFRNYNIYDFMLAGAESQKATEEEETEKCVEMNFYDDIRSYLCRIIFCNSFNISPLV